MRVVSDNIVDEYDCLYDSVPTNPQKLIKELTKHETKLKSTSKSASDLRFGPPSEGWVPKDKHHQSKGSGTGMIVPFPRKTTKPSKDTGMLYALFNKYGGTAKSHITSDCKGWTGADKDQSEWRGRTASTK